MTRPPLHTGWPPSVDFIDNRLGKFHDAFKNPQSHFDASSGQYVPNPMPADAEGDADQGGDREDLRQAQPATMSMAFWKPLFPLSMARLEELQPKRPDDRRKSGHDYSIRGATTWPHVYGQLQRAREHYDGSKKGFWGRNYKKSKRWIVDHSSPVRQVVKLVPNMDYVSPVLAAVEVILDAFETASGIREKASDAFKSQDLERKFGDIEIFLTTFKNDSKIETAAVELVATTLKAIEITIGFFLKSDVGKMFSVAFRGKQYQKDLVDSIGDIQKRSDELLHHARNSDMVDTKKGLEAILGGTKTIVLMLESLGLNMEVVTGKVDGVSEKVDKVIDQGRTSDALLRNMMKSLLDEGVQNRKLLVELNQKLQQTREEFKELKTQSSRAPTPTPPEQQGRPPPSPQQLPIILPLFLHQQQAQTGLVPPQPWFWPMAAGPSTTEATRTVTDTVGLRKLLRMTDMDIADLSALADDEHSVPARERNRTEAVVRTTQFEDWILLPTGRELLVHGDFRGPGMRYVSALSLLCASVTRALRAREHYIALVFFCGSHVERDDRHAGGRALLRSFVWQLCRRWADGVDGLLRGGPAPDVDWARVRKGNVGQLCALFAWLVRGLPEDLTLVCIVDGISHYEMNDFEGGMLKALNALLDLARDGSVPVAVKVLVTSPTTTDKVQRRFKDDDACFLSVGEIRQGVQGLGLQVLGGGSDPDDEKDESDSSQDSGGSEGGVSSFGDSKQPE